MTAPDYSKLAQELCPFNGTQNRIDGTCAHCERIAAALADVDAQARNKTILGLAADLEGLTGLKWNPPHVLLKDFIAQIDSQAEARGRATAIHGIFVHNDSWITSHDDPGCERCRACRPARRGTPSETVPHESNRG